MRECEERERMKERKGERLSSNSNRAQTIRSVCTFSLAPLAQTRERWDVIIVWALQCAHFCALAVYLESCVSLTEANAREPVGRLLLDLL